MIRSLRITSVHLLLFSLLPTSTLTHPISKRDQATDGSLQTSGDGRVAATTTNDASINMQSSLALARDFPDPSILQVGNAWWSFATSDGYHVQTASSQDYQRWNYLNQDALPNLPDWVNRADPQVWAPDVSQRDDGSFIMYFSAALARAPSKHCVGAAISNSISGPYAPLSRPLLCPDPDGRQTPGLADPLIPSPGSGGAIDASGFRDRDGTRYITYKVDGNSLGAGGSCNNGPVPGPGRQHATPIMLVAVQSDGLTPRTPAVMLLDRLDDREDGPLVEAPSLTRLPDGSYALFYSSNCYSSDRYDIKWATASNIVGPYTRRGQVMATGTNGLTSPGGASVARDGRHMVFHAQGFGGRAMYATTISTRDGKVLLGS